MRYQNILCSINNHQVPGISIHYLVPGGLAEMTGLLAVDDEIIEVNGIEVMGKSLDQVCELFCNRCKLFCNRCKLFC